MAVVHESLVSHIQRLQKSNRDQCYGRDYCGDIAQQGYWAMGMYFLSHHRILVNIAGWWLLLPGLMASIPCSSPGFGPLSLTLISSSSDPSHSLLNEFPTITMPVISALTPKDRVFHRIPMCRQPIWSHPRHLYPTGEGAPPQDPWGYPLSPSEEWLLDWRPPLGPVGDVHGYWAQPMFLSSFTSLACALIVVTQCHLMPILITCYLICLVMSCHVNFSSSTIWTVIQ